MDETHEAPSIVLLRSGRNPFQLTLTVGLFLLSTYSLVLGAPSASLDEALAHWQRIMWSALAFGGSTTVLAGVYWKPMLTGLLIERAGMVMMSLGAFAYVMVICVVTTFNQAGFVVTLGLAIGVGAALRARQIHQDLRAWVLANRLTGEDAG